MKKYSVLKENVLYILNLLVSALVLYALYRIIANAFAMPKASAASTFLLLTYLLIILLYLFIAKGILIGRTRGNGIKVSENQFKEIYEIFKAQLVKLEIRKEPALYCVQSNGVLNAFATRMAFRNYVVIYSEILQAAYEEGEEAVSFVLAHELAHIRRRHLIKNVFIYPGSIVFPLRFAYSRACEYTCDAISGSINNEKGIQGLLILAAGRKLSGFVNIAEYVFRARKEKGFWVWFAEMMSTHPNLPKRIRRIFHGAGHSV